MIADRLVEPISQIFGCVQGLELLNNNNNNNNNFNNFNNSNNNNNNNNNNPMLLDKTPGTVMNM